MRKGPPMFTLWQVAVMAIVSVPVIYAGVKIVKFLWALI